MCIISRQLRILCIANIYFIVIIIFSEGAWEDSFSSRVVSFAVGVPEGAFGQKRVKGSGLGSCFLGGGGAIVFGKEETDATKTKRSHLTSCDCCDNRSSRQHEYCKALKIQSGNIDRPVSMRVSQQLQ